MRHTTHCLFAQSSTCKRDRLHPQNAPLSSRLLQSSSLSLRFAKLPTRHSIVMCAEPIALRTRERDGGGSKVQASEGCERPFFSGDGSRWSPFGHWRWLQMHRQCFHSRKEGKDSPCNVRSRKRALYRSRFTLKIDARRVW